MASARDPLVDRPPGQRAGRAGRAYARLLDRLGIERADEQNIERVEQRLSMLLPPSHRSFLGTSNGWRRTSFAIGRIRPAEEVDWFRVENEF
jgi:hypothetical protein